MAFRDRFLTPRVARALTSPSGILLAGAGTSLGILAGLPIVGAAAVGAAAYAARVALSLPRREGERIDLRALGDPWRHFVAEALDARRRYDRALRTATAGPLRDRLGEIGDRLDDGVRECWRIALRGQALQRALAELEPSDAIRRELEQVRRDRNRDENSSRPWPWTGQEHSPSRRSHLHATEEALRAQLASRERIAAVSDETRERLRLLNARLDEAVARAVELALRAGDARDLGGLGSDVDALVGEMEALRQALDETSGAAGRQGH